MGKKEKKRKTSFLRRLYEKITSAPTEPEDPGVDVSEAEEASEPGADQGNEGTSAVKSVIFDQLIAQRKKQKSTILNLQTCAIMLN